MARSSLTRYAIAIVATTIVRNLISRLRRLLAIGTQPSRAEIAARAAEIRARQRPHRSRGVDLIKRDRGR
jgi:hypothetical protein